MSALDLTYEPIAASDVPAAHAIEIACELQSPSLLCCRIYAFTGFPPEEAASLDKFEYVYSDDRFAELN